MMLLIRSIAVEFLPRTCRVSSRTLVPITSWETCACRHVSTDSINGVSHNYVDSESNHFMNDGKADPLSFDSPINVSCGSLINKNDSINPNTLKTASVSTVRDNLLKHSVSINPENDLNVSNAIPDSSKNIANTEPLSSDIALTIDFDNIPSLSVLHSVLLSLLPNSPASVPIVLGEIAARGYLRPDARCLAVLVRALIAIGEVKEAAGVAVEAIQMGKDLGMEIIVALVKHGQIEIVWEECVKKRWRIWEAKSGDGINGNIGELLCTTIELNLEELSWWIVERIGEKRKNWNKLVVEIWKKRALMDGKLEKKLGSLVFEALNGNAFKVEELEIVVETFCLRCDLENALKVFRKIQLLDKPLNQAIFIPLLDCIRNNNCRLEFMSFQNHLFELPLENAILSKLILTYLDSFFMGRKKDLLVLAILKLSKIQFIDNFAAPLKFEPFIPAKLQVFGFNFKPFAMLLKKLQFHDQKFFLSWQIIFDILSHPLALHEKLSGLIAELYSNSLLDMRKLTKPFPLRFSNRVDLFLNFIRVIEDVDRAKKDAPTNAPVVPSDFELHSSEAVDEVRKIEIVLHHGESYVSPLCANFLNAFSSVDMCLYDKFLPEVFNRVNYLPVVVWFKYLKKPEFFAAAELIDLRTSVLDCLMRHIFKSSLLDRESRAQNPSSKLIESSQLSWKNSKTQNVDHLPFVLLDYAIKLAAICEDKKLMTRLKEISASYRN